ncbi:gluconokinase [Ramlibacter sp. AN1015]|uniref:gluconokinase n=1 Tax=Ramlibacter sp. AN1015 TaxID=3133428 RepID=UPI0030BE2DF0
MKDASGFWLVMGVSGSGKSSVAQGLAQRLGGVLLDADDYHPRRNVERMRQGQALDDEHRWPWLAAVAEAGVRAASARPEAPVFIACSALKRSYRDFLRARLPGLQVLYLHGDEATIRARMERRSAHFMAAGMLRSQFQDLEPPVGEPGVAAVSIAAPLEDVLAQCERWARSEPA